LLSGKSRRTILARNPTSIAAAILLLTTHFSALVTTAPAEQRTATASSNSHGLNLALVAEDFTAPIDLVSPPDASGRRFIIDQVGFIHLLAANGQKLASPFLDLRDRMVTLTRGFEERGLLGFAFHPGFAENGRVFVSYSAPLRAAAPAGWNYTRRLSEFTVSAHNANQADPKSERMLLELDWPSRKHNGGGLAFGPDGHLYVGLGDGGAVHGVGQEVLFEAFDVPKAMASWDRFAQDTSSLYGKILRLDVDRGYPAYAIPPLNPLVGASGRHEIYAWGFRNPYRFSFDRGALFVTAVGETLWESVYLVDKPGNYGWPIREATHCFDRLRPKAPPQTCPKTGPYGEPLIDPVIEYPNMSVERDGVEVNQRGVGTAVVGGHVYRGEALPDLRGKYVFGDWSRDFAKPSGQIFVASPSAAWGKLWPLHKVLDVPSRVLSLGRDADGELYVLTNDELGPFGRSGKVYKLIRRPE
jgi:glucose/arabinose dehydrogenase